MRLKILTYGSVDAAKAEIDVHGDPNDSSDSDCDVSDEFDLAIIHHRNEHLRKRALITTFFERLGEFKSIRDENDLRRLVSLPHKLCREAIPLFQYEENGVSEDYQLHPDYCWLNAGDEAKTPRLYTYQLSVSGTCLKNPSLFVPLGRLFVDAPNKDYALQRCHKKRSRLTRWTGFEVLVAEDSSVWIAFDDKCLQSPAPEWYPVDCSIRSIMEEIMPAKVAPGVAQILPSLIDLENATFAMVRESMYKTKLFGEIKIHEVEAEDSEPRIRS